MENGLIKDSQITASSEWDSRNAAIQARLNKYAGWTAGYYGANQWIQVAFGSFTNLTSIATQGRYPYGKNQWVTKYQLWCCTV